MTAALLETGLDAVGGVDAVRAAMEKAIKHGHPRIVDMLLGVGGEEKRALFANQCCCTC